MSSAFEGLPKTPNLKLNKPGYDNVADIEALNENADILDEEIQGIKNTFVKSVNGINAGDDGNVDLGIIPISQGGTGATTAKQARANLEVEPIGTIFAFAGNNIPIGYLPCNGSAISRETYADLFAVIGTTYGSGDGSTTFNLPNLTDRFIQGSDTAGTVKSAGLPNITGSVTMRQYAVIGNNFDGGALKGEPGNDDTNASYVCQLDRSWKGYGYIKLDASQCNSIYGNSTTVQPPALTMRYIIKY